MRKNRARCAVSAMTMAAVAFTAAPAAAEEVVEVDTSIVVTGTLIRGSREDAPAPVDVIDAAELAAQGSPTMLELTKRLAVSAGVIGDASQFDTRSQFNEGTASVNLRGLGPQRTLVLLNGKRVVSTGSGNLPLVDVNLLPSAAISRIEVLKDGAATTYGSDAIAGVVNFITRTDQDGFLAAGDYRWVDGSEGDWNGALSWGGEVGPARLFVSGGYQHRGELTTLDRGFSYLTFPENPQGGWTGGGAPGNFDFNGLVDGARFDADDGCEAVGGFRSLPGSTTATGGLSDLCQVQYLGFTNLVEPEDRFQLFADVAVDLSGSAELRFTGLYGRTETVLTTSPSYLPTIAPSLNAAFGGQGLFVIPPYAPALIDYCARFGAEAGCATGTGGRPVQPALAFPVRFRPLLAGGNPMFDNERQTAVLPRSSDMYQFTGELDVALGASLDLVAGVTYSEYDRYFEGGDSFVDLLQNALAGFGGESCAYATPQSRAGMTGAQLAAVAGTNGCHFFNPFSSGIEANAVTGQANPNFAGTSNPLGFSLAPGAGLINDASTVDDFFTVIQRKANTSQWVGDLVLSGSTGLALGGGEVGFALGAQYRNDSYKRTYGDTNNLDVYPCAGSILNANASCSPETGPIGFLGSNRNVDVNEDVWALFAELQIPVTERIQAQLSARYEDYGGTVGATFDPQARIRIELTDWLALRGGAGTTFRGPPPQNLYSDLVILTFIGGAFRAVDVLGDPALAPETATTYNAGVLVDSGGFQASADWWRYDFDGPIEAEPVSGMVSAMFGANGTANCGNPDYAGLQSRFTFSGGVCAVSNVQRVATYAFNAADVSTSGFDVQASYDFEAGGVRMQAGFASSYVLEYEVDDVVVEGITVQPAFDAAGLLNYQTTAYPLPQLKGQAWLQGAIGDHLLRLQLNHVDGYTDQRTAEFGPNTTALAGASVTAGKAIGSMTTVDLTWRWQVFETTTVSLALVNLLDEDPPFARLDQNFDPFTASPLGFTARFGLSQAF